MAGKRHYLLTQVKIIVVIVSDLYSIKLKTTTSLLKQIV
jgi:hypothetical protein